jgi:hypothetical protein
MLMAVPPGVAKNFRHMINFAVGGGSFLDGLRDQGSDIDHHIRYRIVILNVVLQFQVQVIQPGLAVGCG